MPEPAPVTSAMRWGACMRSACGDAPRQAESFSRRKSAAGAGRAVTDRRRERLASIDADNQRLIDAIGSGAIPGVTWVGVDRARRQLARNAIAPSPPAAPSQASDAVQGSDTSADTPQIS